MRPCLLLLVSATVLAGVWAATAPSDWDAPCGRRTLVVLENEGVRQSHSLFLSQLRQHGQEVAFVVAAETDGETALSAYGEFLYDTVVILAPSEDISMFDSDEVVAFLNQGGNVVLAASSEPSTLVRDIASECGVEFDAEGAFVIDHVNYDASDVDGDHSVIRADAFVNNKVILGDAVSSLRPVLYHGIGMVVDETSLLTEVLKPAPSAYSAVPDTEIEEDSLFATGSGLALVTALQARNNARVVITGSMWMLSDAAYLSSVTDRAGNTGPAGNQVFADAVLGWVLQERGVLRHANIRHALVGQQSPPRFYTIRQDIKFSVDIFEWNGASWAPYVADDVQLEFVMLDPYVRTFLKSDGKGTYSVSFKTPDVYGIFKFNVNYRRQGMTLLSFSTPAPVRPLRHTEYERFIPAAFPYYATAFSMMASFVVLGFVTVYHREARGVSGEKQKAE